MQRYTVYLYLETALHVSGGTSTHHQEHTQLYLQHLVVVKPLLLPAAGGIILHNRKWQDFYSSCTAQTALNNFRTIPKTNNSDDFLPCCFHYIENR
jgi:hypothetical protein